MIFATYKNIEHYMQGMQAHEGAPVNTDDEVNYDLMDASDKQDLGLTDNG